MGCPCTKGRKVFPSQAQAARALGINRNTVAYHLNTHGNLDRAGMGNATPGRNIVPRKRKPVTIHGAAFPTIQAASDALGLNYWTLHKRLRQPMTPAISDDLLGRVMRWQAQQRKAA